MDIIPNLLHTQTGVSTQPFDNKENLLFPLDSTLQNANGDQTLNIDVDGVYVEEFSIPEDGKLLPRPTQSDFGQILNENILNLKKEAFASETSPLIAVDEKCINDIKRLPVVKLDEQEDILSQFYQLNFLAQAMLDEPENLQFFEPEKSPSVALEFIHPIVALDKNVEIVEDDTMLQNSFSIIDNEQLQEVIDEPRKQQKIAQLPEDDKRIIPQHLQQPKPIKDKSFQDKPLEEKPFEDKSFEKSFFEEKSFEDNPSMSKFLEETSLEDKSLDEKPHQDKPAKDVISQHKSFANNKFIAEDAKPINEVKDINVVFRNQENFSPEVNIENTTSDFSIQSASQQNTQQVIQNNFKENEVTKSIELNHEPSIKSENFEQEFSNKIEIMIQSKENFAKVNLDPPELGKIEINIKQDADKTHITFHVNHEQTRELIESTMLKLRIEMEQQGLHLGNVNVSQEQAKHQQDRMQKNPMLHLTQSLLNEKESEQAQARISRSNGQLDLYA